MCVPDRGSEGAGKEEGFDRYLREIKFDTFVKKKQRKEFDTILKFKKIHIFKFD